MMTFTTKMGSASAPGDRKAGAAMPQIVPHALLRSAAVRTKKGGQSEMVAIDTNAVSRMLENPLFRVEAANAAIGLRVSASPELVRQITNERGGPNELTSVADVMKANRIANAQAAATRASA